MFKCVCASSVDFYHTLLTFFLSGFTQQQWFFYWLESSLWSESRFKNKTILVAENLRIYASFMLFILKKFRTWIADFHFKCRIIRYGNAKLVWGVSSYFWMFFVNKMIFDFFFFFNHIVICNEWNNRYSKSL